MTEDLDALVSELEDVAGRLRSGSLEADEAAALVEGCAELAQRIGSEIDSRSRSAAETQGQERLL